VIDLLQGSSPEQATYVLAKPREALAAVRGVPTALRDPRLSGAGNWLAKHLTQAVEALTGSRTGCGRPVNASCVSGTGRFCSRCRPCRG